MAVPVKNALITSFLSRTRDRFHEYNIELSLEERLALASRIEGITGVEVVHHYETSDPETLRALLSRYGLSVAAINANVKAEPDFRDGGITSVDPAVRAKAVGFIKGAKDFAKAVGADKVTCCPLGDGYEFNFHCDYARMWRFMVESFGEAAAYLPEIPLHIEYKPGETRARCFLDTAAKAICLLRDMRVPGTGVTIDFGHSIWARENPAEALVLIAESGFRYYVHINDNDARWDWDLIAGSHHFLAYVEFLYYLLEYGYEDFLTSDTSPTRLDIAGTFAANARVTSKIWTRLQEIDRGELRALIERRDFLATWRLLETQIFRL
jgi:xylose isomerase